MIWNTLLKLRHEKIGIRSAVIWIILWLVIGVGGIFPVVTYGLVELAQMNNSLYFIIIVAVLILFALVFNLTSQIDQLKNSMGKIVQEISLLRTSLDENEKRQDDIG